MSVVMSAYFVGFLGASRLVPKLIRRVEYVRVFAALASFISAIGFIVALSAVVVADVFLIIVGSAFLL